MGIAGEAADINTNSEKETVSDTIQHDSNFESRDVLKRTLSNLIAMRDALNRQIDELIQLI
jgi:hypothetical protein